MITLQFVVTVLLALNLVDTITCQKDSKMVKNSHCPNVTCEEPPTNSKCQVVATDDKSVLRPRGKQAECCPLWKCKRNSTKSDFFTFHGLSGSNQIRKNSGTETVNYKSFTKQGNQIFNSVSSVATGNHAATAVASDTSMTAEQAEAEIQNAFKDFGLKK